MEEFFNSDAPHHNDGADAVFDLAGVAGDVDLGLEETVVDDIKRACIVFEERALLSPVHSMIINPVGLRILCQVRRVDILGSIDVIAELPVINLLSVSKIAVFARDKAEIYWRRGHQTKGLQHSDELMARDVLALGSVEIVEPRFEENPLGDNFVVETPHYLDEAGVFGFVHQWGRLGLFDGAARIRSIAEDEVQVVAEVGVTDKANLIRVGVLVEELTGLRLINSNVKRADAGAEL